LLAASRLVFAASPPTRKKNLWYQGTADTATQTKTAENKSHGTQTETESCVDIGTADEIVAFAADLNQQVTNLPVSIGMSDLDESMTDRREVHIKQVQQMLSRYSHDLSSDNVSHNYRCSIQVTNLRKV